MDKQYLNDEFNRFFDFPTEDKSQVSSVSAKLFAEHIAYPLEREIEQLRQRVAELETLLVSSTKKQVELTSERDALKQKKDELVAALENCRLLAARHRKEEWATHILRFCGESGVIGSPIRDNVIASVKEKS